MKISESIKVARQNAFLTQEEFARQCDLLFRFPDYELEPTLVFPTGSSTYENGKEYYRYVANEVLRDFEQYK